MKNKKKIIRGLFWHCHHNELVEYCYNQQERIRYIKRFKPYSEVSTRLRLFKKVKGLQKDIAKVVSAMFLAETNDKKKLTPESFRTVTVMKCKLNKILKSNKKYFNELHKKQCGCREWRGGILNF